MKIRLSRSTALFLSALLLAGCGKKDEIPASGNSTPTESDSVTPTAVPSASSPAAESATVPPGASGSAPQPMADSAFLKTPAGTIPADPASPSSSNAGPTNGNSGSPENVSAAASGPGSAAPEGNQAAYEAWFRKYNLDLSDPKMLDADPDGDGFSNREEFLADTDPHDANSHPGVRREIRLKEYNEARLPLTLESVEGDRAHIRRQEQGTSRVEIVRTGDLLRGLPLRVEKIESRKEVDKNGTPVDASQIILEDSSTKERVTLVKDLPAKTAASYAVLSSPDGKTTLRVRQGDVFTWPIPPRANYKVIDLSKDQAVLQQLDNQKMLTVPRM